MSVSIPTPRIRVMIQPGLLWAGRSWALAVGDVPRPTRRCQWLVVAYFETEKRAERAFELLNPGDGRALFDMTNEILVFVDPDGREVRCLKDEATLLS